MTEAEKSVLAAKGLTAHAGLRLSCQIQCDHDMTVKAISRSKAAVAWTPATPGGRDPAAAGLD